MKIHIYKKLFLKTLIHNTSNKNIGVDIKLRLNNRFGSFKKRGNHSKPFEIQNWLGLLTLPA